MVHECVEGAVRNERRSWAGIGQHASSRVPGRLSENIGRLHRVLCGAAASLGAKLRRDLGAT